MFGYEEELQDKIAALKGERNNFLMRVDEMLEYIEMMESMLDEHRGTVREIDKIISDGDMPEIYDKLIAIREKYGRSTT